MPQSETNPPRLPRIDSNKRNQSNTLFDFGGQMDYPTIEQRYDKDITKIEKQRVNQIREKQLERIELKRELKDELEVKRWADYGQRMDHEMAIVEKRRQDNTPGKSSVGYNILNSAYLSTVKGGQLEEYESANSRRADPAKFETFIKRESQHHN